MSTGAIGPLDQALPEQIRSGGPAAQKAYNAALGFEQLLVQQLSRSITGAAGSTDGLGGSSGDTSSSPYASLLPDALTQGIMNAGGLGLAQQLAPSLEQGTSR